MANQGYTVFIVIKKISQKQTHPNGCCEITLHIAALTHFSSPHAFDPRIYQRVLSGTIDSRWYYTFYQAKYVCATAFFIAFKDLQQDHCKVKS